MSAAWFSEPTAGLVGAALGTAVGVTSGVYGTVAGVLAPRGRAKGAVFTLHWGLIAVGAVLLLAGAGAAADGQPWFVWFVLVLPGAVMVGSLLPMSRLLARRYREAEERRMRAADLS